MTKAFPVAAAVFSVAVAASSVAGGIGCSKGGTNPNLPLVTPPVKAATPAALGGSENAAVRSANLKLHAGDALRPASLDSGDIRSRFFTAGPTNLFMILGAIDDRIQGLNAKAEADAQPCLSQPPVSYTITPFGESIPFVAQCFESEGNGAPGAPGFVQFGQANGATYYYSAVGAMRVAAILTPLAVGAADGADAAPAAGPASGSYRVQVWAGVGYLNGNQPGSATGPSGFDNGSYGVLQLEANAAAGTFEMAVAGIGFGYCGAQLKSDGHEVYAQGSIDMATTCTATDTFCVQASDVASPGTCDSPALTKFALTALGRQASTGPNAGGPGNHFPGALWSASQYPGGAQNGVTLDGTDTDSLHFGPSAPTPGVGAFGK